VRGRSKIEGLPIGILDGEWTEVGGGKSVQNRGAAYRDIGRGVDGGGGGRRAVPAAGVMELSDANALMGTWYVFYGGDSQRGGGAARALGGRGQATRNGLKRRKTARNGM
jgi:hypothetical protein